MRTYNLNCEAATCVECLRLAASELSADQRSALPFLRGRRNSPTKTIDRKAQPEESAKAV
ncbi:MAG: hypothetical protein RBS43_03695 [Candidatus Cloacimonas sp.]|jgi:hypothetical protein|nr:hypothetical protein [Candidatus Cloacimonas sp.]